jgi:hypothetical protein
MDISWPALRGPASDAGGICTNYCRARMPLMKPAQAGLVSTPLSGNSRRRNIWLVKRRPNYSSILDIHQCPFVDWQSYPSLGIEKSSQNKH